MHPGLITCPPETSIGQAAALLVSHRVHALIVAAEGGEPLGVLSDTDLLAGEWLSTDAEGLEVMLAMTAGDLLTAPIVTVPADATASEAAARLQAERISRLLVVEDGRPVGVVTVSNLVASLARASTERRCVADVMSRGIVVCLADTTVPAAARAMSERRSRSLVVVDAQGKPLGVVTGFDLLAHSGPGGAVRTVADLMRPPLTISPDASLRDAADLMLKHEVHRLLVVDPADPDHMPLGLISTSDIVAEMAAPGSPWQV
jgi:CBS domain-containing protein